MKVKKTIGIPVVIGIVSAAVILLAAEAEYFIPLSEDTSMGIGELFTTLSAALVGPIASIVTLLLVYNVHIALHLDQFADPRSISLAVGDAFVHLCALLVVVFVYFKLLYPRARKSVVFLAGWWLTVGADYYLAFLPLSVLLLNIVDPDMSITYPSFARDFFPEFLGTAFITTVIWFAAPAHFRHPQWLEPKNAPEQRREMPGE